MTDRRRIDRDAIVRLSQNGLSPAEIATRTGYLGPTVRATLHRYRKTEVRRCAAWGDAHGKMDEDLKEHIIRCNPTHLYDGGDALDARQASPHHESKDVDAATVIEEIERVARDIRDIAEALPVYPRAIEIMSGNHDQWVKRSLFKDKDARLMQDFFLDPIELLVNKIPGATMKRSKFQYVYPDMDGVNFSETQFLNVVGDTLLSHMNFTAKWPGGAVLKLREWMGRWRRPLGITDLSLMVQFHGHKMALLEEDGGHVVLVEPGMAAMPQVEAYKVDYQPKWSPGVPGAVYFEQHRVGNNWVTDRASIQLIRPHRNIQRNVSC